MSNMINRRLMIGFVMVALFLMATMTAYAVFRYVVEVEGTATIVTMDAGLEVDVSEVNFGMVQPGDNSEIIPVEVTNVGDETLHELVVIASGATPLPDGVQLAEAREPAQGEPVEPGESWTVFMQLFTQEHSPEGDLAFRIHISAE